MTLIQVGWWIWNSMNPNNCHFSDKPLKQEDRENGYQARPVYINSDDKIY